MRYYYCYLVEPLLFCRYGVQPVKRICSFLACTNYGFREPELMELLQSTDSDSNHLPLNWMVVTKELGEDLRSR